MILALLLSLFLQSPPPAPPSVTWTNANGIYTPSCPTGYSVWQHFTVPYPPPAGSTTQDGLVVGPATAGMVYTNQALSLFCHAN